MSYSRRYLPSISLLTAFEATARLGSVSAASKELNLTQSAVSRQIKALEEQLQVELFVRDRQTVRANSAGMSFLEEIRGSLNRISKASQSLYANPNGGILNVTILSSFGTRWLAPRIADFARIHPGITVNLKTRFSLFDFREESADAAIHYGAPYWPGAEMAELRTEVMLAVCSPELRERYRISVPADLLGAPLLYMSSMGRLTDWERWFAALDLPPGQVTVGSFDQFSTVARAATTGLGVGLLPSFLIQEELMEGRLVKAVDTIYQSQDKYYLAWPEGRKNYPPLLLFRDWIIAESQREDRMSYPDACPMGLASA